MSLEQDSTHTVSSGESEKFERQGYLLIESPVADDATIDSIVADLEGLYTRPPRVEDGVFYYARRIQDAWRINENVKALACAPAVLALLKQLYGRTPLPFQTLNFRVGTEQAPHSDSLHFSSMPENYMCGVWIALEDIDMENGPLVYYPGSHKLPFVSMQDVGVKPESSEYPRYEDHIAALIQGRQLEPEYGTIRKGHALVWSANLLHGGAHQQDPRRTRHSQVTHYFFEGCRYYTPMLSKEDSIEWRDPEWIT
jgi:ectoine hydroxylase-related dioxygenase (phytanoyl-CoA dioxygenase family)